MTSYSVPVLVSVHSNDNNIEHTSSTSSSSTKGCFKVSSTLSPSSGNPCTAAYSCYMFLRSLADTFPQHLDGCSTISTTTSSSTTTATKMLAMEAGLMGIFTGVYEASGAVSDTYLHHQHHSSNGGGGKMDMSVSMGDIFVKEALHGILPQQDSSASHNTSFLSNTSSFGDIGGGGGGEFGHGGAVTAAITGAKESAHIMASAQAFLGNHHNNTNASRQHHHSTSIHIGDVPTLSIGGILLMSSKGGGGGLSIVASSSSSSSGSNNNNNSPLLVVEEAEYGNDNNGSSNTMVMSQLAIATALLSLPAGSTLPIFLDATYSSYLDEVASILDGVQDVLTQCGIENMTSTTMMMNRNGGDVSGHEGRDAERRRQRQIWGLSTVRSRLELWVLNPPTNSSSQQDLLAPLSFICGPLVPVSSGNINGVSRRQLYVSSGAAGCSILEGVVVVPTLPDFTTSSTVQSSSSIGGLVESVMAVYKGGSGAGSTVPGSPVTASPPSSPRTRAGMASSKQQHLPPPAKLHLVTFFTLLAEMASERDTYRWNMDYLFKQLLQFQLPSVPTDDHNISTTSVNPSPSSSASALLGSQLSTAYAVSLSYPQRLLLLAAHSLTEKAAIVSGEIAASIEGGLDGDGNGHRSTSTSPIISRAARMSRISRLDAAMGVYSLLVDDGFGPCSVSPMFNFLSAALCVPKPRIAAPPTTSSPNYITTTSPDDAPLYDISEVPDASSLSSTAILNVYYAIMVRRLSWRLVLPSADSETSMEVVERRLRKVGATTTTTEGATSRIVSQQHQSTHNAGIESAYTTTNHNDAVTSPPRRSANIIIPPSYSASPAASTRFEEDLQAARREVEQLISSHRPSSGGDVGGHPSSASSSYTPQSSIDDLISEVTTITAALFAQQQHLDTTPTTTSASHAVSRLRARREVLLDHVLKDFIPHLFQASARSRTESTEAHQQLETYTKKHLQQQGQLRSQLTHLKQTLNSKKSQQESTVRSVLVFLEASLKAPLEDSLVDYERRIAKRRKFLLGEQFLESNNEVSPRHHNNGNHNASSSHMMDISSGGRSGHNISGSAAFTFSDALKGVNQHNQQSTQNSSLAFIDQSGGVPSTIAPPSHHDQFGGDDYEHHQEFYSRQDDSFTRPAAGGEEASSPIRGRKDAGGGGILRKDPILSLLKEFRSCCDGWLSQAVLPMVAMLHDLLDDFTDGGDTMVNQSQSHQHNNSSHNNTPSPSRNVSFTTEVGGGGGNKTGGGGVEHLLLHLEQLLHSSGDAGGDDLETSSASISRLRASASKSTSSGRRDQDGSVTSPTRRTGLSSSSPAAHGHSSPSAATAASLSLASGAVTSLVGSLDTVALVENLEQELHAHRDQSAELSHRLQVVIRERDEARRQVVAQNNNKNNGSGSDGGGVHSTRLEGMLQSERQERNRLMSDAQHKDLKIKTLHLSLQDQQATSSDQALEIASLREGKEQLARLAERLENDALTSRDHYHEMESQMANNEAKYRAIKFDYERVLRELDRAEEANLQERIRVAQLLDAKGKLQAENACANTKLQRLQGDSQRRTHRANVSKSFNSQFETLSKSTTFTRTPEKGGDGGTTRNSSYTNHYDNTSIGASYNTTAVDIMNTSSGITESRSSKGQRGYVLGAGRSNHGVGHHLDVVSTYDEYSGGTWEGVGEVRVPLAPVGLASYSSKAATTSTMECNATNATLRQYTAPTSSKSFNYDAATSSTGASQQQQLEADDVRRQQRSQSKREHHDHHPQQHGTGTGNTNKTNSDSHIHNISGMYAPAGIPLDTSCLSHKSNRSRASGSPKVIDLLPLEQLSPTNTRRHNSSMHRDEEDVDVYNPGCDTDNNITHQQPSFGSAPPKGLTSSTTTAAGPMEGNSRRRSSGGGGRAPSVESGDGAFGGARRGSGLSFRSDTDMLSTKHPSPTSAGPTTTTGISYSNMMKHPAPKAVRIPVPTSTTVTRASTAADQSSSSFTRTAPGDVNKRKASGDDSDGPQLLRVRPKSAVQY